jgi:hypothetical protein
MEKEEEGDASRLSAYQCSRSGVGYAAARYRSLLVCADDLRPADDELILASFRFWWNSLYGIVRI